LIKMQIVRHAAGTFRGVSVIPLPVERHILNKKRWRGVASDGTEFGFDLDRPLRHQTVFFQTESADYVIRQSPEILFQIPIISAVQAAKIAWQIGNLHFPVSVGEHYILAEDDPAVAQMLGREKIPFAKVTEVFEPFHISVPHSHGGH